MSQVNRAVLQNTWRRLCQVQVQGRVVLLVVPRHPAAWVGGGQDAAAEVAGAPVLALG
jgi:hypothetical protein